MGQISSNATSPSPSGWIHEVAARDPQLDLAFPSLDPNQLLRFP